MTSPVDRSGAAGVQCAVQGHSELAPQVAQLGHRERGPDRQRQRGRDSAPVVHAHMELRAHPAAPSAAPALPLRRHQPTVSGFPSSALPSAHSERFHSAHSGHFPSGHIERFPSGTAPQVAQARCHVLHITQLGADPALAAAPAALPSAQPSPHIRLSILHSSSNFQHQRNHRGEFSKYICHQDMSVIICRRTCVRCWACA